MDVMKQSVVVCLAIVSLVGCAGRDQRPFVALHSAPRATLPPIAVSWSTPLGDLTRSDVATLCRFEQTSVSPAAVRERCDDGRTVTVGASGGFCDHDALTNAQVIGGRCALSVGDLVGCELALRENPCAMGASALPECAAFDACTAQIAASAAIASR